MTFSLSDFQPRRNYTGVGSRATPPEMLEKMYLIAKDLHCRNFWLRSGGAAGADSAFARGAGLYQNIFRPHEAEDRAMQMAATLHPRWRQLPLGHKLLHARNCYQVLGKDLNDPSAFLVCWTPDGCHNELTRTVRTGGTATAIVLAARHGVPVFNLQRPDAIEALKDFLRGTTKVPA